MGASLMLASAAVVQGAGASSMSDRSRIAEPNDRSELLKGEMSYEMMAEIRFYHELEQAGVTDDDIENASDRYKEKLVEFLQHPLLSVRMHAVRVAAEEELADAIPSLAELLDVKRNPDRDLGNLAIDALDAIAKNNPDALPAFVSELDNPDSHVAIDDLIYFLAIKHRSRLPDPLRMVTALRLRGFDESKQIHGKDVDDYLQTEIAKGLINLQAGQPEHIRFLFEHINDTETRFSDDGTQIVERVTQGAINTKVFFGEEIVPQENEDNRREIRKYETSPDFLQRSFARIGTANMHVTDKESLDVVRNGFTEGHPHVVKDLSRICKNSPVLLPFFEEEIRRATAEATPMQNVSPTQVQIPSSPRFLQRIRGIFQLRNRQ